jgi:hypothetical protein
MNCIEQYIFIVLGYILGCRIRLGIGSFAFRYWIGLVHEGNAPILSMTVTS